MVGRKQAWLQWMFYAWGFMPVFALLAHALALESHLGNLFSTYFWVLGVVSILGLTRLFCLRSSMLTKEFICNYFLQHKWNVSFLLLFVWGGLATLQADNLKLALYGTGYRWEGYTTYCIYVALYICAILVNKQLIQSILKVFLYCSVPLALVSVLQYGNISTEFLNILYQAAPLSNPKFAASFYNINHYGYYLVIASLLSYGLYVTKSTVFKKWELLIILLLNQFALIVNNSFGPYLAVVLTMLGFSTYLYFVNKKLFRKSLWPLLSFAIFSVFANKIVVENFTILFFDFLHISANDENARAAGSGRWKLWTNGFSFMLDRPFFGYGPEGFEQYYAAVGIKQDRPHNEYLQCALFMGIPALVFYLSGLWSLLRQFLVRAIVYNKLACVLFLAIIGYLLSAFVGNTMPYTYTYFVILLGFMNVLAK